jgi:hypothetical protein
MLLMVLSVGWPPELIFHLKLERFMAVAWKGCGFFDF